MMGKSNYTLLYIWVVATLLLTACENKTVYNYFLPTSVNGWERNDTLFFNIPPIKDSGNYKEEICIRTNRDYPFLSMTLIIEQTNSNKEQQRDTLLCNLIDKKGHPTGNGISRFQNTFRLKTTTINKGDSLRIAIRHDMKREMLPGITDIGVKLTKLGKSKNE